MGETEEILSDVASSQIKSPQQHLKDSYFPKIPISSHEMWLLVMQMNIPTNPAEGFESSPAPREQGRRQVHVHPCGIIGAPSHPTIQMAASHRNSPSPFLFLSFSV